MIAVAQMLRDAAFDGFDRTGSAGVTEIGNCFRSCAADYRYWLTKLHERTEL
jgi:hypothetical protein